MFVITYTFKSLSITIVKRFITITSLFYMETLQKEIEIIHERITPNNNILPAFYNQLQTLTFSIDLTPNIDANLTLSLKIQSLNIHPKILHWKVLGGWHDSCLFLIIYFLQVRIWREILAVRKPFNSGIIILKNANIIT